MRSQSRRCLQRRDGCRRSSCGLGSPEPYDYVQTTAGDLQQTDEFGKNLVRMGRFRVIYLDVDGAIRAGVSVFDVIDCEAGLDEYYVPLFGLHANELAKDVQGVRAPKGAAQPADHRLAGDPSGVSRQGPRARGGISADPSLLARR